MSSVALKFLFIFFLNIVITLGRGALCKVKGGKLDFQAMIFGFFLLYILYVVTVWPKYLL